MLHSRMVIFLTEIWLKCCFNLAQVHPPHPLQRGINALFKKISPFEGDGQVNKVCLPQVGQKQHFSS